MEAIIYINGHVYPAPNVGLGFTITTTVDAGRNANNVVVGQRVGRDNDKIDNLVWQFLEASTWSSILQEFETNFYAEIKFPDMVHNAWHTRVMYPGDRTAEPFTVDPETGLPTMYKNCKMNLVDTGR